MSDTMTETNAVAVIGCSAETLRTAVARGMLYAVRSVFTGELVYRVEEITRLRQLMNVELSAAIERGSP